VRQYCTKEGSFITNLDPTTLQKKNVWLEARTLAKEGRLLDAIDHLESTPQGSMQLSLNGDRILKNFSVLMRKPLTIQYALTSFSLPSIWERTRTLILSGTTNTGKTSLAKALLPTALFISHIDRLREYNPAYYDGVIFDDMSFKHLHREAQIHLVDTAEERDIHGRNVNGRLPAGTPRIITTNSDPFDVLFLHDPAIKRRVVAWKVVAPDDIVEFIL